MHSYKKLTLLYESGCLFDNENHIMEQMTNTELNTTLEKARKLKHATSKSP